MEKCSRAVVESLDCREPLLSAVERVEAIAGRKSRTVAGLLLGSEGVLSDAERLILACVYGRSGGPAGAKLRTGLEERLAEASVEGHAPGDTSAEHLLLQGAEGVPAPSLPSKPAGRRGVPLVIPAAIPIPGGNLFGLDASKESAGIDREQSRAEAAEAVSRELRPSFPRPEPELAGPVEQIGERMWAGTRLRMVPVKSGDPNSREDVAKLMAKSSSTSLMPPEADQLLKAVASDPKAVVRCGIAPRRAKQIAERNPEVAAEAVRAALRASSQEGREWAGALASADVSLRAMDAVSRLVGEARMPEGLVGRFALACIREACEKDVGERMARMAAGLAKQAIETHDISRRDELAEVEALSLQLAHLPEGASLYSAARDAEL